MDSNEHDNPSDSEGSPPVSSQSNGQPLRPTAPEAFGRAQLTRTKDRPEEEAWGRGKSGRDRSNNQTADKKKPADEKDEKSEDTKGGDPKDEESGKGSDDRSKDKDQKADKAKPEKKPFYKRLVPMLILGTVLVVGIVIGVLWWLHARQFETTDDAFVEGHVIPISPKVAAIVQAVHFDDNTRVKRGSVLMELDPRDFQVIVDQTHAAEASARGKLMRAQTQVPVAKANVGDAEAGVSVAKTAAENANQDYDRIMSLDPRARSKQQVDSATATKRSSAAQVEQANAKLAAATAQVADADAAIKSAQADVERATADVKQAEINLSYCTIVAPDDGLITRKSVEPGQYVQVAQPMFSIVPTEVWITANYKETQLDHVRIGQPVDIEIDAYPDRTFHGRVDSIQNGTGSRFTLLPPENATGNYVKVVQRVPVKITFDRGETEDPAHLLSPGLSANPKVHIR